MDSTKIDECPKKVLEWRSLRSVDHVTCKKSRNPFIKKDK